MLRLGWRRRWYLVFIYQVICSRSHVASLSCSDTVVRERWQSWLNIYKREMIMTSPHIAFEHNPGTFPSKGLWQTNINQVTVTQLAGEQGCASAAWLVWSTHKSSRRRTWWMAQCVCVRLNVVHIQPNTFGILWTWWWSLSKLSSELEGSFLTPEHFDKVITPSVNHL